MTNEVGSSVLRVCLTISNCGPKRAKVHSIKKILETQELYVDVYLKGRLMLVNFIQEDLQVILSVENQFIKILTCLNLEMMKLFS